MEHNGIKVSVIMPVYKVEEYVGKAIESIQAQTLNEWEFLIVDDGTPDRSGEICDEYAAKDDRIHVIHKENGGAPSARNIAIDIAKGECIFWIRMIGLNRRCLKTCITLQNEIMLSLLWQGFILIHIMKKINI